MRKNILDEFLRHTIYLNFSKLLLFCSVYHGKAIEVYDCGDEIAQFISPFLFHKERGIRLGMHCDLRRRDISDSMLDKSTINLKSAKAKVNYCFY